MWIKHGAIFRSAMARKLPLTYARTVPVSLQKGFACLCIRKKHGNIYNLIKVRFGRALIWNERTDVRFMFIGNRRYDASSLSLADVVNDKI